MRWIVGIWVACRITCQSVLSVFSCVNLLSSCLRGHFYLANRVRSTVIDKSGAFNRDETTFVSSGFDLKFLVNMDSTALLLALV